MMIIINALPEGCELEKREGKNNYKYVKIKYLIFGKEKL